MSAADPDRSHPAGPVIDEQQLCSLLLHPDVCEEALERASQRRRAGIALTLAAGMSLAPTVSLAEESPAPPPIVSAACQITGALPNGTPSGVLTDGSVCVQPVSETTPAPAPDPEPAPEPEPGPAPAPDPPAADTTAAPADPAPASEPPAAVDPPPAGAPASPAADTPAPDAARAEPAGPTQPASATAAPSSVPRAATGRAATKSGARRSTPREPGRPSALRHSRSKEQMPAAAPAPLPNVLPSITQGSPVTPFFVTDEPVIPRFLIDLYKQAGRRYHVPWPILAAVNEIETDFGRNVAVSSAGATGWMQFMPATWRAYGVDADHDGVKDPNDPRDAIFAAARYLKASGAEHNMRRAIFAYNHAGWYVDSILLRAERIASHQGERNRRLERLFRAGERRLEQQVLADPRITLYECGRQDIEAHRVDRRVLVALRFLAWSGLHPTVTSLECGHGVFTSSGNVSEHSTGSAVDIAAINGIPIFGNQGSGSVTEATVRELLTLRGAMKPHQIISLMSFDGADNTVAMSDHADHIHLGFHPLEPLGD